MSKDQTTSHSEKSPKNRLTTSVTSQNENGQAPNVLDGVEKISGHGTITSISSCTPSDSTLPSAVAPSVLSALLVIIGWFVVNKTQANRERRKQIREYVASLRNSLDALEQLVITYHTNNRKPETEREIISKLGRFERDCSSLPSFLNGQFIKAMKLNKLKLSDENLRSLRSSMTLNHFGGEHVAALAATDLQIQEIEQSTEIVQSDLDQVRIAALD